MNKSEKLLEIFKLVIYAFAAFGALMFMAYIYCLITPSMEHIPMMAILQTIIYVSFITVMIGVFLTDVIFEKISYKARLIMFLVGIYIAGLTFFQYNAPNGPFDGIKYFLMFSVWLIWFGIMGILTWNIYSSCINSRYNQCLERYKKSN